jgi:hypothetical protein
MIVFDFIELKHMVYKKIFPTQKVQTSLKGIRKECTIMIKDTEISLS